MKILKYIVFNLLFVITISSNYSLFAQTVFTVTSANDPVNPFESIETDPAFNGEHTLRWAINKANLETSSVINFDIPGSGEHVITMNSSLPIIVNQCFIDGTTQNEYQKGNPSIIIDFNLTLNGFKFFPSSSIYDPYHPISTVSNSGLKGLYIKNSTNLGVQVWCTNYFLLEENVINRNCLPNLYDKTEVGIVGSDFAKIIGNYFGTDGSMLPLSLNTKLLIINVSKSTNIGEGTVEKQNVFMLNSTGGLYRSSGIRIHGATTQNTNFNKVSNNLFFSMTPFTNAISLNLGVSTIAGNFAKLQPIISQINGNNLSNVTGTSEPGDIIELFGSTGAQNASIYLTTVTADASGNWQADLSACTYNYITATATDALGNTSELAVSNHFEPIPPCENNTYVNNAGQTVITIKSSNDPLNPFESVEGDPAFVCEQTLRWAINEANKVENSLIVFDIPGSGAHTITLKNTVSRIAKTCIIDGTTQVGGNSMPLIEISGVNINNSNFNMIDFQQYSTYYSNSHFSGIKGLIFSGSRNALVVSNRDHFICEKSIFKDLSMAVLLLVNNSTILSNQFGTNSDLPNNQYGGLLLAISSNNKIGDGTIQGQNTFYNRTEYGIWINANSNQNNVSKNLFSNTISNIHYGVSISNNSIQNKLSKNLFINPSIIPTKSIFLFNDGNNEKPKPIINPIPNNNLSNVTGTSAPNDIIELFGSTGSQNVNEYLTTVTADASGNWQANLSACTYNYITATATDALGNTSELAVSNQFDNFCSLVTPLIYTVLSENCLQTTIGFEDNDLLGGSPLSILNIKYIFGDGTTEVYGHNTGAGHTVLPHSYLPGTYIVTKDVTLSNGIHCISEVEITIPPRTEACRRLFFDKTIEPCSKGFVSLSIIECDVEENLQLHHVTWEMGDGNPAIITSVLTLDHQYSQSGPNNGNFHITAVATYSDIDGNFHDIPVFVGNCSILAPLVTQIIVPVFIFEAQLELNPNAPFNTGETYDAILNYTGGYFPNTTHQVILDGNIISSSTTFPVSGSIIATFQFTEGVHLLQYKILYLKGCSYIVDLPIYVNPFDPNCNTVSPISTTILSSSSQGSVYHFPVPIYSGTDPAITITATEFDFGDNNSEIFESVDLQPGQTGFVHSYSTGSYTVTQTVHLSDGSMCVSILRIEVDYQCQPSFSPVVGKRYWLSAWVKEEHLQQKMTYQDSYLEVEFISTAAAPVKFRSSGEIIEGWQRIVGDFVIPTGTTDISINLGMNGAVNAYFDDVRIHPFNASMKSYVYDPVTFLLTAELDDNNYATFYEYDNEGQLIRIKKETERGVMTIQESRSSNPKN